MRFKFFFLIVTGLVLEATVSFAINVDSLFKVFNSLKLQDTLRLKAIDDLSWNYVFVNPDSAIIVGNIELGFARKVKQPEFEAYALNYIATGMYYKSKYPEALKGYFQSLAIFERIKNQSGLGTVLGNIGNLYMIRKEPQKALTYFDKCVKIFKGSGNKQKLSTCYANIGLAYHDLKDFDKSLANYKIALKVLEEIEFTEGVIVCCINMGNIYQEIEDYDNALIYLNKSLEAAKRIDYKQAIAGSLFNIGMVHYNQNKYKPAIKYSVEALSIFKEMSDLNGIKDVELKLSDMYTQLKDYTSAYLHYKKYISARDSIFNAENTKKLVQSEMNYEFEKKELAAKAEQDKLNAIALEEKQKQQLILYFVLGGLVLVIIFSTSLFKRFKITQQQKKIIENQKHQVDMAYDQLHEKNKEIMDSINYASRIQRALITSEKYIQKHLGRLNR